MPAAVVVAGLRDAGQDRLGDARSAAVEGQAHDAVVAAGGEVEEDRPVPGEAGRDRDPEQAALASGDHAWHGPQVDRLGAGPQVQQPGLVARRQQGRAVREEGQPPGDVEVARDHRAPGCRRAGRGRGSRRVRAAGRARATGRAVPRVGPADAVVAGTEIEGALTAPPAAPCCPSEQEAAARAAAATTIAAGVRMSPLWPGPGATSPCVRPGRESVGPTSPCRSSGR